MGHWRTGTARFVLDLESWEMTLRSSRPWADTIFALSSGAPPAAIAVIRISGPAARLALERLIGRVPEPRRAALAKVTDPVSADLLDEALALWFPGPRSETGEDLAELQIHGGRAVIAAVLKALADGVEDAASKPALASLLATIWHRDYEDERDARFINDRVHANIQNDSTFSVVPRMRGGVTTPDELRRIADVADKYNVRMVKVTGSQRIDLLGVTKADLPSIWSDLGMPSGQAYTKGVKLLQDDQTFLQIQNHQGTLHLQQSEPITVLAQDSQGNFSNSWFPFLAGAALGNVLSTAVGGIVGQIAKLKGCRAVGVAGGPDKCRHVVEELGFDAAIDYKAEDVAHGFREHCPRGIDVYFDNVGGEILDAALVQLARHARVVICGAISQYNAEGQMQGPANYMSLLVNHASMTGFVVSDYGDRLAEGATDMGSWLAAGKLKSFEDIATGGVKAFSQTLLRLFEGKNTGKLVLEVAET